MSRIAHRSPRRCCSLARSASSRSTAVPAGASVAGRVSRRCAAQDAQDCVPLRCSPWRRVVGPLSTGAHAGIARPVPPMLAGAQPHPLIKTGTAQFRHSAVATRAPPPAMLSIANPAASPSCMVYVPRDLPVFSHRSCSSLSQSDGSARSKPRCVYSARTRRTKTIHIPPNLRPSSRAGTAPLKGLPDRDATYASALAGVGSAWQAQAGSRGVGGRRQRSGAGQAAGGRATVPPALLRRNQTRISSAR